MEITKAEAPKKFKTKKARKKHLLFHKHRNREKRPENYYISESSIKQENTNKLILSKKKLYLYEGN